MPSAEWSAERVVARGKSETVAEEIAARTVNKERAQYGEAVEATASSVKDIAAGQPADVGHIPELRCAAWRSYAARQGNAESRGGLLVLMKKL